MNCSALNTHLFIRNLVESPNCICGITETVSHVLFVGYLQILDLIQLNIRVLYCNSFYEREQACDYFFYLSFIQPLMEYADVIWDNKKQNLINKLENIQLDAARIVTGGTRLTSHDRF
jgi:hypothetical protein